MDVQFGLMVAAITTVSYSSATPILGAAHFTPEQAAAFVLEHFRKQIDAELAMVKIECHETHAT